MPYTILSSSETAFELNVTFAPFGTFGVTINGAGITYDIETGLPTSGTFESINLDRSSGDMTLSGFENADITLLSAIDLDTLQLQDIPTFLSQFKRLEITLDEEQSFFDLTYFDSDDRVVGSSGHDQIGTGEGADFVRGELGNDTIHGGGGDDKLLGNHDDDYLVGGEGHDKLVGGLGDDQMFGDVEPWYSYSSNGTIGQDQLFGGNGRDSMYGGVDMDLMVGGAGRDYLDGGTGNDDLKGGTQADRLNGGSGDDDLRGGAGADEIYGGGGYYGYGGESETDNDMLYGGKGNDFLQGGSGTDGLYGGAGSDYLDGGYGADALYGGAGEDVLSAISYGRTKGRIEGAPLEEEDEAIFDEMTGGADADVFVFSASTEGPIIITDFTDGEDMLQMLETDFGNGGYIQTARSQYRNFRDDASDVDGGVLYESEYGAVMIEGITMDDLNANDFLLSIGGGNFGID